MVHDSELLRRYAEQGSEEAFAELVHRYLDLIYAAALRQTRDPHQAKDVVQTVFVDLARKSHALSRRSTLLNWLYTSTHYAAAKMVRTERRRQLREGRAAMISDPQTDAASDGAWEQLRPVLDQAMHELDNIAREAILLRFFQGLSFSAIGDALCLTDEAARKRVDRAIDKLRVRLARRGITSTASGLAVALANQPIIAAPATFAATLPTAALAAIATSGSPTLITLLTSTAMTKTIFTATGIVLLLSIVTAINQTQVARKTEAIAVAVNHGIIDAERRLHELEQRAREMDYSAASTKNISQPGLGGGPKNAFAVGQEFVANHPEARPLIEQAKRARLRTRFEPLYKSLALTPTQIDLFEDILVQGPGAYLIVAAESGNVALPTAGTFSETEVENQLRDFLGTGDYSKYLEFQRTASIRQLVSALASPFLSDPLQPSQVDQVVQILANTSSMPNAGGRIVPSMIDWPTALAQARNSLPPSQFSELTVLYQQIQYAAAERKLLTDSIAHP